MTKAIPIHGQHAARRWLCTFFAVNTLAITSPLAWAEASAPAGNEVLFNLSPAAAEAATALTLPQAIDLALAHNAELAVARRELAARDGALVQSAARPNPELAYAQEDTRRDTRSQSLQLNLPIEMGGKRAARMQVAERGRDLAQAELANTRQELRAAVVTAFFDVLAAQARMKLAQDSVDLAQRGKEVAAKRVLAGKVSPVEETKAQVAEAGVKLERLQAQTELQQARLRLSQLWSNAAPRFSRADGSLDALPVAPSLEALQTRVAQSPVLKRAALEIAQRQAVIEVERSKRLPDVTFSLGIKRSEELQRNQLLFGVSLPIPLLDSNRGNLQEAVTREEQAREQLRAIQSRLSADVLQARERLSGALAEIDIVQRELLPGARSAYQAATIGFEHGKFGFLDVLDAQRSYFQAQALSLKALAEAHRAASDIDRLLGDSVERPAQLLGISAWPDSEDCTGSPLP